MTKPRNKMLEPPKNLLRPVVSDIHRRSFVFVDIYRSKSECIIKLINVRSFTKAFGICRHSPANVDIHYFRTLTVTYVYTTLEKSLIAFAPYIRRIASGSNLGVLAIITNFYTLVYNVLFYTTSI
jgi:hypothetical protein